MSSTFFSTQSVCGSDHGSAGGNEQSGLGSSPSFPITVKGTKKPDPSSTTSSSSSSESRSASSSRVQRTLEVNSEVSTKEEAAQVAGKGWSSSHGGRWPSEVNPEDSKWQIGIICAGIGLLEA
ncbi:hypothetical protein CIPAW_04G038300 [Carya illinoinensis]|uniref:Uncharacterized protein n=1 Tax=Carya illinoinensis TaxID=32201 RepID=A0A8T1QP96_CARIL|nr:hypothetical protein CIPAW_04G038300 [Carya illinoinensis]